ncbi:hypothetical protein DACRYDRAFT_115844 [Dacryopinax primogenitus]|uniref:Uncharacterized protein n=1 Tax=Dacryopinax primogenitus (strain DJM 731) TaxID=1858805 RepID=M5GE05_DACPD|nr:uncharacterized protein DACRYDRAFT_115844 [Dacryopinax primogenitus]EJU02863.1 hypothetical protein DACRYDRAFT_115844 [Dacryopinax primogenitus]
MEEDPIADLRYILEELTQGEEETWFANLAAVEEERNSLLKRVQRSDAEVIYLRKALVAAQEHVELLRSERPTPSENDENYENDRETAAVERSRISEDLARLGKSIRHKEGSVSLVLGEEQDIDTLLREVLKEIQRVASSSKQRTPPTASTSASVLPPIASPEINFRESIGPSSSWVDPDAYVQTIAPLLDAVDRLRAERDDLRRSLDFARTEYRFTVADLEERLTQMAEKVKAVDSQTSGAELQSLRQELEVQRRRADEAEALERRLDIQKQELSQAEATIARLQTAVANSLTQPSTNAEGDAAALRAALSHAVGDAQIISDQLAACETRLATRQEMIEALQEELEEIGKQRDALGSEVESLQASLARAASTVGNEVLKNEHRSLKLEMQALEAALLKAEKAAKTAQHTVDSLRAETAASNSGDTDETVRLLRAQRDDLQKKVVERDNLVHEVRKEIMRVDTNLKMAEMRIERLGKEATQHQARKEELKKQIVELEAERTERIDTIFTLEAEKLELQNALNTRATSQQGIAGDYAALLEEKEASDAMQETLQARIDSLHQIISEFQASEESLKAEHQDLTERLRIMESAPVEVPSNDELVPTIAALFAAVHQKRVHQSRNERLDAEITALRSSLGSKSHDLQIAIATIEATTVERAAVQAELVSLKEQQSQSATALVASQAKVQKLSEELSTARTEVEIMLERVSKVQSSTNMRSEEAQEKLELLEKTSQELQARLTAAEEELQAAVEVRKQLEEERERLRADLRELDATLISAQQEAAESKIHEAFVGALQIQLEEREKELATVRESNAAELASEREAANAQTQELTDTVAALESTITALESKTADLETFRQKAGEFDGLNQQMKINHQAHMEETKSLREELVAAGDRATAEMSRAEQLERQLVNDAQAAKQAQQELQSQLHELEQRVKDEQALNAQLTADLTSAKESASQQERASVSLQFDTASAQSDLKREQAARVKLQDQIDQSMNEITRLQAEVKLLRDSLAHAQDVAVEAEQKLAEAESRTAHAKSSAQLVELNSRIEDLEAQLRKKSTEVEEADDKMIVVYKEKKKLEMRVDTLNKKLTSLQAKLVAAKDAPPAAAVASKTPATKAPMPRTVSASSDPSGRKSPAKASATFPSTSGPRSFNRTTSVPTNIFGNSTDPVPPPPAASTEQNTRTLAPIPAQISPIRPLRVHPKHVDDLAPSHIIGQKRPLPIEFTEPIIDKEYVPAPAPTPKSPASTLRKLSKNRTGFTPVRSPAKRTVSDITNLGASPAPLAMKPRVVSKPLSDMGDYRAPLLSSGRMMSSTSEGLFNQITQSLKQH